METSKKHNLFNQSGKFEIPHKIKEYLDRKNLPLRYAFINSRSGLSTMSPEVKEDLLKLWEEVMNDNTISESHPQAYVHVLPKLMPAKLDVPYQDEYPPEL